MSLPDYLNVRTRAVLRQIAGGAHRLMPCGDLRAAETLRARGILRSVGRRRAYTTDYAMTDEGLALAARLFSDIPDGGSPP